MKEKKEEVEMEKQLAFSMVISRGVVVANENNTAIDIANLLSEHNIGAVVILREEKLVGIVSERDIVRRVVAKGLSPEKAKAKDFMTKEVVTANLEDGLDNIYKKLCSVSFRHLPIMEGKRVFGIVSQRDILYGLRKKE
ncbi:CBS domain-containing protein [bacterium]|nr:MAG: CBS domain-containing protein [bacterium]